MIVLKSIFLFRGSVSLNNNKQLSLLSFEFITDIMNHFVYNMYRLCQPENMVAI